MTSMSNLHADQPPPQAAAAAGSWTARVGGPVRTILRAEAIAILAAGIAAYGALGGAWLAFVPLLIAPDISMIGYVRDTRLGALTYDLGHNLATAGAALGLGLGLGAAWLAIAGAVLVAHVGMDRAMGYGLKYPTTFKDTHLQHV